LKEFFFCFIVASGLGGGIGGNLIERRREGRGRKRKEEKEGKGSLCFMACTRHVSHAQTLSNALISYNVSPFTIAISS
jgi:hypothetical protein